jgi:chromatin assembly factor 1 subunit B
MKVETPQILWNSEGDKGKNAPLYSIAMQESGIASDELSSEDHPYGHVLVTAGNTNIINLWKVCFRETESSAESGMFHKERKSHNKIDYMTSLMRHELPVNSVAFSPDGLHLATAGEAGSIIVWSVPLSKRGNGNGRHFWSTVSKENDLSVRIVSTHCEGVCDISWSADSKRFVVGTIDSQVLILEDKHFATNQCSPETHQKESEWQSAFRNGEHSSFVQGVAYDPLGVYIASMGSDRTVRVFPRKTPPKSKKKVLRPSNAPRTLSPPQEHQRMVSRLLTESKIEIGKTKRIKQRSITTDQTEIICGRIDL